MRQYLDEYDRAMMRVRAQVADVGKLYKERLEHAYKEAVWRLNELEAVVQERYFQTVFVNLLPNYGERRNIWRNSWGEPERKIAGVHLGDLVRGPYCRAR
jgi:hypothetical protein